MIEIILIRLDCAHATSKAPQPHELQSGVLSSGLLPGLQHTRPFQPTHNPQTQCPESYCTAPDYEAPSCLAADLIMGKPTLPAIGAIHRCGGGHACS